jgi:hypothetical protein
MRKYCTKKAAQEIIDLEKERRETIYLDGVLSLSDMKRIFEISLGFGEAEANFILASMIKAGAKFLDE